MAENVSVDVRSTVKPMAEAWRRQYFELVDRSTRAWEQRFRHRQYRRFDEALDDLEAHQCPEEELRAALEGLLDNEGGCFVLAASAQETDEDEDVLLRASKALARDLLSRAEVLGYFAEPCPDDLRFPEMPIMDRSGGEESDEDRAWREYREAGNMLPVVEALHQSNPDPERLRAARARCQAALERLKGIQDGSITGTTLAQAEKARVARHTARRRKILLAYVQRLDAAGHDATWVEIPPGQRSQPRMSRAGEMRAGEAVAI